MKRLLLLVGALLLAEPALATTAAPEIFVLSPASPPAGAPQGTLAGTFSALDRAAPEGETWLYQLVTGDGDDDNVRFQVQQDKLVTWQLLSAGSYAVRARASGSSGTTKEKAFHVQVGGSTPDTDSDGLADEVEAFLGSNPADPGSQARLDWQVSGATFRLAMPRAADLSGLDGYVETSDDLVTWRSIAAKEAGAPWVFAPQVGLVDDGSEVEITVPLAGGHRFYRLRAETHESPPDAVDVRAISLVLDFADQTLEEYSGSWPVQALKSPSEIRTMLEDMEAHWSWMSTGTHRVKWDQIRVRLDQDLRSDSFPGWVEFRHAVADKIKARVNPADYDADGDGNIDMCFYIVANNDANYDYLVGGASTINGVNSFSDGQASDSVRARAIGNFNHEAGHNLGLVDLYGERDTVKYLSLMSDSWPVPPFGFSAFDRYKLGWVNPPVIDDSTTVVLDPAEENLDAILIRTEVATEYFLVEYRKKPATGYGSGTDWAHPAFNGLAIYHIDETKLGTGNNAVVPPLIKLETPAGTQGWEQAPATQDFWYPGNPAMTGPSRPSPTTLRPARCSGSRTSPGRAGGSGSTWKCCRPAISS